MESIVWAILTGVATVLILLPVLYRRDKTRQALIKTVNDLASQSESFTEQMRALHKQIQALEVERRNSQDTIDELSRQVRKVNWDLQDLAAGATRLIDQIMQMGQIPVWNIPQRFLRRETKSRNSLSELQKKIVNHFSTEELEELVFEAGFEWDQLPGEIKGLKAIEFILIMKRSGRLPELIAMLREHRSLIDWEEP